MNTPLHSRRTRRTPSPSRNGQAIVEFIVGIVVVLVLVAGLLQIASLSSAHTNAMVEARRQAAQQATSELEPLSDPDFIRHLDPGTDLRTYTADDDRSDASDTSTFQSTIVDPAGDDHWDVIDSIADNEFSAIQDHPTPATQLGLVQGEGSESVDLLPGFQRLIYDASSIDVECEVWMTRTTGIY